MEAIKEALKIQLPNPEQGEKMAQVVEEKKQEEKKKIELRVSGGGIGGLLIFGGVLAAAALFAALRNRSRRRPTNKIIKDPPTDPSEEQGFNSKGDGVISVLQTPSPSVENRHSDNESSIIHSTTTAPPGLTTIKSLIVEKHSLQINGETEVPKLVNGEMDISRRDLPSADGDGITEKGISTGQEEDDDKNKEDTESETSVEIVATFRESIDEREENPSQLLANNNKEEEEEEEEEGGSDVTGDSSMESNAEAIWPAEIIEGPLDTEIKGRHTTNSGKMVTNEGGNDAYMKGIVEEAKGETGPVKMKKMQEIQSQESSSVVVLVSSMVGVLLFLLLSHLISKSYVPSVSWPSNSTQSL